MSINKGIATLIQERLNKGAEKSGRDIPLNDKRDFLQESIEEAGAIYLACYLIQIKKGYKMKLTYYVKKQIDSDDIIDVNIEELKWMIIQIYVMHI